MAVYAPSWLLEEQQNSQISKLQNLKEKKRDGSLCSFMVVVVGGAKLSQM
jgi:hypothetical protein